MGLSTKSHENLRFDIKRPAIAGVKTSAFFKPSSSVETSQAARALRTYFAISSSGIDEIPGLTVGRLHVPESQMASFNNWPIEDTVPSVLHPVWDVQNDIRYWVQIFKDRSAVIMVYEDSDVGVKNLHLLRVMPIAFRLSDKVIQSSRTEPWSFTVRSSDSLAELLVKPGKDPKDTINFFDGRPSNYYDHENFLKLRKSFDLEVMAWGREILNIPWITEVHGFPNEGVFGKDAPAPNPELHGKRYVHPAALSYCGFTTEQYKAAHEFLKLAVAQLIASHTAGIRDYQIAISTAQLSQINAKSKISIKVEALASASETREEATTRLSLVFKHLLNHPSAPEGLKYLTASAYTQAPDGSSKQNLSPFTVLYIRKGVDTPSAHETLKAFALFKDWDLDFSRC